MLKNARASSICKVMAYHPAFQLAILMAIAILSIYLHNSLTDTKRTENQVQYHLERLRHAIGNIKYTNHPIKEAYSIPQLGEKGQVLLVYPLLHKQQPLAYVIETFTPWGYGGDIQIWVTLSTDGTVRNILIGNHHETPGIGDRLYTGDNPWVDELIGLSLASAPNKWMFRRAGGEIDNLTGATISTKAVRNALKALLSTVDITDGQIQAKLLQPTKEG